MAAPFSTVAEILTDLTNITYSATSNTVARAFQILPEDFVDFEQYPVFLITDGNEEGDPQANKTSEVTFHPEIHFFAEGETPENMAAWRDSARDAIMTDATLGIHSTFRSVDSIVPSQSDDRSIQRLIFTLTIEFHVDHSN